MNERPPWPVMIEYLFPTDDERAPTWIAPGDILPVSKFPNCAMLLHVTRTDSGDTPVIGLTVVPIAFGTFQAGKDRNFALKAPAELNPAGPLPVFPPTAEN